MHACFVVYNCDLGYLLNELRRIDSGSKDGDGARQMP